MRMGVENKSILLGEGTHSISLEFLSCLCVHGVYFCHFVTFSLDRFPTISNIVLEFGKVHHILKVRETLLECCVFVGESLVVYKVSGIRIVFNEASSSAVIATFIFWWCLQLQMEIVWFVCFQFQ